MHRLKKVTENFYADTNIILHFLSPKKGTFKSKVIKNHTIYA